MGAVAAGQMIAVVLLDGFTRAGYDTNRNWVSQLALGPRGWLGCLNFALCGAWLVAYAIGLHLRLRPNPAARWAVALVLAGAAGLVVLTVFPTDSGLGFPPGTPAAHTRHGLIHQWAAAGLFAAGVGAAVLLGTCIGSTRWGLIVGFVMLAAFVVAWVLVVLDIRGVSPGAPSGLFERVALFTGFAWMGAVGLALRRSR